MEKKSGLDAFHDFRKVYEGYEDEEWGKAEHEWRKTPEGKTRELADKAWDEHYKKTKEIGKKVSKQLIGKYGDKKLNVLNNETYGELISDQIHFLLASYNKL